MRTLDEILKRIITTTEIRTELRFGQPQKPVYVVDVDLMEDLIGALTEPRATALTPLKVLELLDLTAGTVDGEPVLQVGDVDVRRVIRVTDDGLSTYFAHLERITALDTTAPFIPATEV